MAAATSQSDHREATDGELVARYRQGVESAYAELVRRHQIPIFRVLLGLLGDADRAEPLCEHVFFVASQELASLLAPEAFGDFLLALARREAEALEAKEPTVIARPQTSGAPRARIKFEVREALRTLPGAQRLALVLTQVQRQPTSRVATVFGISEAEAESLVHAARQSFASALRERGTLTSEAQGGGVDDPLHPGDVLASRYEIEDVLGRGAFGAVHRARDRRTGQQVAIKVVLPEKARIREVRRRFEREARAIARLRHPAFVNLIDFGQTPLGVPYLVMELVDGFPLRAWVHEPRPAREALAVARSVLVGLEHAHGQGVVHRDLKPENVMLLTQAPGEVKILDLGISKVRMPSDVAETKLTHDGQVFGTPAYMAPEQALGEEVDGRADLYAVAVMLFEMLTARAPFEAVNAVVLMAMHLAQPPPPLPQVATGPLAGALEQLLAQGMEKKRERRFSSAAHFRACIDQALALASPPSEEADGAGGPLPTRTPSNAPANTALGTALSTPSGTRAEAFGAAAPSALSRTLRALGGRTGWLVAFLLVAAGLWLGWLFVRHHHR